MTKIIDGGLCPACGKHEVYSYSDPYVIQCDACLTKWYSKYNYEVAVEAMAVADPDTDYITSGGLAEDVQKLMDLAEVRLLKELETYLPSLAGGADEVPVAVLEHALRDIRQGISFREGSK